MRPSPEPHMCGSPSGACTARPGGACATRNCSTPHATDAALRGSSARACSIGSRTDSPAPSSEARPSARSAPSRSSSRRRSRPRRSHAPASEGPAVRRPRGGLLGEIDRAHVLVDARGEAMGGGTLAVRARPVAHRARGRLEVAGLPERERHQAQHGDVARFGVARVDQPLRRERELALGHRALGGEHEALDALGRGVGFGEVDEFHAAGGNGANPVAELDACPLLDFFAGVLGVREIDAGDRAHPPLRV